MKYSSKQFIKTLIIFLFLYNINLFGQHLFKEKNITAGKFGIGFELGIPFMGFALKYNSERFWFLSTQLLPGDGSGFIGRYNHYTFTYGTKLFENRYQTFSINTSYTHLINLEFAPTTDYFSGRKQIRKHSHHLCLGMQYESSLSRFSGVFPHRYVDEESPIAFNTGFGYIFGKKDSYPLDISGSYYLEIGIIFYFNTESEY